MDLPGAPPGTRSVRSGCVLQFPSLTSDLTWMLFEESAGVVHRPELSSSFCSFTYSPEALPTHGSFQAPALIGLNKKNKIQSSKLHQRKRSTDPASAPRQIFPSLHNWTNQMKSVINWSLETQVSQLDLHT